MVQKCCKGLPLHRRLLWVQMAHYTMDCITFLLVFRFGWKAQHLIHKMSCIRVQFNVVVEESGIVVRIKVEGSKQVSICKGIATLAFGLRIFDNFWLS
jgi:hypothetical protein